MAGERTGIIAEALAENTHAIRARWTPEVIERRYGIRMQTPVSSADADELYRRLADHFRAWTGQELHGYTPAPTLKSGEVRS